MTGRWIVASLLAALSVSGWGQSHDSFSLTAGQVAATLSARGVSMTGKQVSLLANVVATEPNPLLDILSVNPLGDLGSGARAEARSSVKMACHQPDKCLPFYVLVTWARGADGAMTKAPGSTTPAQGASFNPGEAITMRAGTHATLVMDDHRAHIQVAVISLENGIAGHKIHVASPDHKQIYVGEVVSANLLKRSF
jgi:hypothetical protein